MRTPIERVLQNKNDCCGCSACFAICPVSAIRMSEDEEGFLYPEIDQSKCIGCRQCQRTCPVKAADENKE